MDLLFLTCVTGSLKGVDANMCVLILCNHIVLILGGIYLRFNTTFCESNLTWKDFFGGRIPPKTLMRSLHNYSQIRPMTHPQK